MREWSGSEGGIKTIFIKFNKTHSYSKSNPFKQTQLRCHCTFKLLSRFRTRRIPSSMVCEDKTITYGTPLSSKSVKFISNSVAFQQLIPMRRNQSVISDASLKILQQKYNDNVTAELRCPVAESSCKELKLE